MEFSHYVVTSFSDKGYQEYGAAFIESYRKHWQAPLLIYHEGCLSEGVNLLETEPCRSFLTRHDGDQVICGKKPDRVWKKLGQYNFRYDAWKFSRKIFAIAHAAKQLKGGKLFWVDADVVTHNDVTPEFLDSLLPEDICYLARPGYHSECGFVGYNLDSETTRLFIREFESIYATDAFIPMDEWHDSWIFDRLIEYFEPKGYQIPHNNRGQPFDNSILGQYMTHYKGNRKGLINAVA